MKSKRKVVVIGGGFAGVQFIRTLSRELFDVLLLDKVNHHQFQPLFYQVATSQIEPSSISFPLRNIFKKHHNVQIRLAHVEEIDRERNTVKTRIGDFTYHYLVIAIGCSTNFFGNGNIAANSFTLKSTYDAITIRNHILQTFEDIISANEQEREALMNLVIVGAGPTGVEMAGAFAEIKQHVLPKDYPGIDFTAFKINLIEGSKDTLANMSTSARSASASYLRKMGVQVITETFVKDYDGTWLELSNGNRIKTKTVIWSAGVIGNEITGLAEQSRGPGKRIKVDRLNCMNGSDNVFAIGDIAYMETPLYPKGHPQVANVAINQAINLANNLQRIQLGKALREFEYKDLGSMATIGRNKAVVDLPHFHFKGYFAWLVWMFLHLMLILSVRNKLIIFINWAFAYFTKDTSLRLILNQNKGNKT